YTRRQFLITSGKAGVAGAMVASVPAQIASALPAGAPTTRVLTKGERSTLRAAVARIVPAEQPGDWSGADVEADQYILGLLAGTGRIYARGPTRRRSGSFQSLSRVNRTAWGLRVRRPLKLCPPRL